MARIMRADVVVNITKARISPLRIRTMRLT
jgi:hypothetical protein